MLHSGKQRSSANDNTLSDRELRKLEADGVVLEQKLDVRNPVQATGGTRGRFEGVRLHV